MSHLNLLRHWYTSSNEPYAIFCEDDVSFESINYWNFSWNDFITNLPSDWECVQLMRMTSTYQKPDHVKEDLKLVLRRGRWWGSHSLMKREYVKKILDRHCLGYNKYRLVIPSNYMPIIENVLFLGICPCIYNFPMLVGNLTLDTTVNLEPEFHDTFLSHHDQDFKLVLNAWKNLDSTFDIKKILNNPI